MIDQPTADDDPQDLEGETGDEEIGSSDVDPVDRTVAPFDRRDLVMTAVGFGCAATVIGCLMLLLALIAMAL